MSDNRTLALVWWALGGAWAVWVPSAVALIISNPQFVPSWSPPLIIAGTMAMGAVLGLLVGRRRV